MNKLAIIACTAAFAAATAGSSGAQTLSGSLESGARAWFASSAIPTLPLSFEASLRGNIGASDAPGGQYQAEFSADCDPATGVTTLALGELWAKAYLGALELTVGNQVVAWGSTDVFNPVDIVNPLDLSFPADQAAIPMAMARAQVSLGALSLDLVALPWWKPTQRPAGAWAKSPDLSALQANPALAGKTPIITYVSEVPAASWENIQVAGRLAASLGLSQGLDLGLSLFHGFASTPSPTYAIGTPGATTFPVTLTLHYYRLDQAGLDFAWALDGGLLVKGEAAYRVLDGADWLDPDPSKASAEGVGGLEYTILGVKTVCEYVADWTQGGAGEADQWSQVLLLAFNAQPGPRLALKALGAYDLDGSGLVSGQASYTLADGLVAGLRLFAFFGEAGTRYGDWSGNAFGELTLGYSF